MTASLRRLLHLGRTLGPLLWSIQLVATPVQAQNAREDQNVQNAGPLPPRSAWHASSSTTETPAMASPFAIDNDLTTHWGGAFSAEHWLQVDLSDVAQVGGVLLHWDSGFAASYRIVVSIDGHDWTTVFETTDGQGGLDYVFFPPTQARYVRLASLPLSADWGVSVLEIEPLSGSQTPRLTGFAPGVEADSIWGGGVTPPRAVAAAHQVTIQFPRPLDTTGLQVLWGSPWQMAILDARDASGRWRTLASDSAATHEDDTSLLADRKPIKASVLRLRVAATGSKPPSIRRLRLLPPDRAMTPLRRYQVVASRGHRDLFPLSIRNQQVYWTVVGIPAGRQKSIFDEFGNLEAWKGAPMVQPLWRDSQRRTHAAHSTTPVQTLRDGWMPLPKVEWSPEPGLLMQSETFTIEQNGQPVTLLRHRLQNTNKKRVEGELSLLVRPVQVNPQWQSGGIAPIRDIALEGPANDAAVRVNGRLLLRSLSPVQARGASEFGANGEGELTQSIAWGAPPTAAKAHDYDGLGAAFLRYNIKLAPGEKRDVVLAFPLGNKRIDLIAGKYPEPPAIDRRALVGKQDDAGATFDELAAHTAQLWAERVGRVGLTLPNHDLVDMLRAQIAYMLINQTGPAIQPGPRNYNRSFIRDGSATAVIMMRMGLPEIARDYLRWYGDHALHENGLVSPILNDDGTVNDGFGSDLEHDSQGEFVGLVADVARLDGGPQTVREYLPKVRLALKFLQQLRERTLVPGYQADREMPERFRGIIAPSISHEGYSVPTHSYWDDFYALKGWHDGAWLAASLGNAEVDTWARSQYAVLRESVAASIRAVMAWKKIDTIPAAADLGDLDPTSTSIALDPCGQLDLLPPAALKRTFDIYMADVRKRNAPGSLWAFTPYEIRNVLSYVRMNRQPEAVELLETMLRWRRPMAWQEFAEVVHSRLRYPKYLGDMPHTWIGVEYVRSIFGMLMREADDHLDLLPGAPPSWFAGEGLTLTELRTAYGKLTMTARQDSTDNTLKVTLGDGLLQTVPVEVTWPSHTRPKSVVVDGEAHSDQTEAGIRLAHPFKELVAQF